MKRFIFSRPALRRLYWLARAPFSAYAAYRLATEQLAQSLFASRRAGAGYRVATGPFAGLIHTRSGSGVNLPCLVGVYEHEIHDWIDEVIASRYDRFVDIGCAEGYYASGFALRTGRPVVACDVSRDAKLQCAEMARLNQVDHLVTVRGGLTHNSLESLLSIPERSFVFCDIEGAEAELLDPLRIPSLCRTDMIVEIHGSKDTDTLAGLSDRFAKTHELRVAEFAPVGIGWLEGQLASFLLPQARVHAEALILALAEPRGYSRWVFFKTRSGRTGESQ